MPAPWFPSLVASAHPVCRTLVSTRYCGPVSFQVGHSHRRTSCGFPLQFPSDGRRQAPFVGLCPIRASLWVTCPFTLYFAALICLYSSGEKERVRGMTTRGGGTRGGRPSNAATSTFPRIPERGLHPVYFRVIAMAWPAPRHPETLMAAPFNSILHLRLE